MAKSPSRRKRDLRDKKIAVAVFHYVHNTTDLVSIAETLNVNEQTLTQWQKTQTWHDEMQFYSSHNTVICEKLGLDQMTETGISEMDGSLTKFAWAWGHIFQEGIEFEEIEWHVNRWKMKSETKCSLKRIGIENVFQGFWRLARIGYQNVRTILSFLF